ncbi:MAG: VTT domain-containing protein, partial [Patescibacteria group bacterium]
QKISKNLGRGKLFFQKKHLEKTKSFYAAYGKNTIILARFVPVVRTFAPIMAGVGQMNYRIFLSYNLIGGIIWGGGLPLVAYFLGRSVPGIDQYLLPIVILIIVGSFIPALTHLRYNRER